jgi:hypothetical protein
MNPCSRCGAQVPPAVATCPYCGAITRYGQELERIQLGQHQARGQMQLAAEWSREQQRERVIKSSALQSLIFSLFGLVTCCLPLASFIGVVQGVRAWVLASRAQLAKPALGVVGLIVGLCGLALSGTLWAWFGYEMVVEELDKRELEESVARAARSPALAQPTACDMLRLELLRTHYKSYYNHDGFECHGQLARSDGLATLHDARIVKGSESFIVFGCFKRGADRWLIHEVRDDARCSEAAASPAPSGSVSN